MHLEIFKQIFLHYTVADTGQGVCEMAAGPPGPVGAAGAMQPPCQRPFGPRRPAGSAAAYAHVI